MGLFLAGSTWLISSTLLLDSGSGIVQGNGGSDQIVFLQIALSQSWLIFISRYSVRFERMQFPSLQLVAAILAVDIVATLFCLFGWLTESGPTDIETVILVWIYSFGSTVILFLVFFLMNHVYNKSIELHKL